MKYLINVKNYMKHLFLTLQMVMLSGMAAIAQDGEGADINVDIGGDDGGGMWYTQWWVWVLVLLVFIIIIVAITNRGKKE